MKKRMWGTSALLIGTLLLGACSGGGSAPAAGAQGKDGGGEEVKLTILHRWPNQPMKGYFDGVIEEFRKLHPNVEIQVINILGEDYKQKINVLLGNNNPPDLFFTWVGEYGEKFIREGKALDLTSYAAADPAWSGSINKAYFDSFSKDGKIYGVPFSIDAKKFYYNKDIFAQLNLQPPKTWSEFISVLGKLKEGGYTPIGLGNKAPWVAGHYLTTLNQRMVAPEVLAKDYHRTTGEFTDPAYIGALEKLQQLRPYFNADPNALSHEDEKNLFLNGKSAVAYFETNEFRFMKDVKFQWGLFDFPTIEEGKGRQDVLTGAPEGFMISAATKHPEEAVEFVKFLTSKAMAEKWVKETNYLSVVKGAVNSSSAVIPNMVEAAQQLEQADTMALWIDNVLDGRVFQPYLSGVQKMLNGESDPARVMKDVQTAAKEVQGAAK
ncbi:ABC transporter substrate-binding protein [Paenibacillus mucilaginosus]|uniref:Putative fructose amino acid-binding lipoprotein n=1 Tax=Paenibacillus mucilaginosus (strain KNP414) TaxID=1036673 RepID=F8FMR2_PAEMK|nr:extracellular solute-binding protein [Paenibacillus mucilaginosus]AEI44233.1 putative fructose amino acid-binding lipoprotein [Paenibacillus mucilaginosus KNP414]MCG7216644.1 extracellular solute-binding protein [Paenibacillus mucilaginosus]WDM25639.1 extracellular solute-binding protein [Paenibacillus mucilaginosus]